MTAVAAILATSMLRSDPWPVVAIVGLIVVGIVGVVWAVAYALSYESSPRNR